MKPATAPIPVLHPITRLIVGGAQENTLFTAALLDKQRFQVEVLSGPQTGSEGSLIEEVRQRGVPLTILPDLLRQVSPGHDVRALLWMARFMRRKGFRIVHTHSSKAGILGRLAARLAGVPVIVHTVHGWSFHDYMSPLLRSTYILLERWTASFSDALIAVAERDIQKGLQAGIGKEGQYHLIRSAIPLDEFDPSRVDRREARQELGIPEDAIVIGNVGRFSPQKNPLDWARVAGVIGRANPQARFLLVGDGPLRPQVEAQLEEEGVLERTTLTGLRRDAARMMSAMDLFLLTSLWEGLPRVIPQAMAMGLPVIANRADGVDEAIRDGESGFLCPPGEIEQMAARCLDLLHDPHKRLEIGQKGRAYALQEFDLRQMIAQIEGLYERLLLDD
ncbi:MAG: glycosyltransferase family 4 protein [Anaerolineales bacterium]|nr:glycosyltransferase family 4 protein [Anaerolineales bacterium]